MRAVVCRAFGPLEDLVVEERPSAPLPPGCARIAVSACGVNYVDGLFVQGRYQIKPPVPFVPGMEVVGYVTELADGAADGAGNGVTLGERVFVNVGLGGYASDVVAPVGRLVRLPDSLSDGQAATFMQSYLTGWFALRERAKVQEGKSLLVLGAGGGVGLAAVDIGAALGLRVIAVASTEEKRELARSRGALEVVDPATDDVKERAKAFGDAVEATGGVDYLYDPIGGDQAATLLRALGEDGQYLVIGFVAGIPQLPANQVLLRNRRVTGVDWGAWAGRNPQENERLLHEVLAAIEASQLHPVEPTAYPLDDAVRALTDLAERKVAGKVTLVP